MQRQAVVAITLLWLSGACLRLTILAVPPLLPLIRAELHLLGTEIGILNGIPLALFALAAVPGSLLIGRLGTRRTLLVGLLATAIGGALRAVSPGLAGLYGATAVMGFGVAILQPLLAVLVRDWLPNRIGFGTALYTNGLLVGEVLPVYLTLPLVLPWLGGDWRLSLGFWSLPVLGVGCVAMATARYAAPQRAAPVGAPRQALRGAAPLRRAWWPRWGDPLVWQLGLLLGTINAMYFAVNAFLPPYLASKGWGHQVGPALTALNAGQLPASFLLLGVASRLERRAWPYLALAGLVTAGIAGLVLARGVWIPVCSGILGFSGAAGLTLALTLPPLLSAPADVARTSAAMFTLSYSGAVVVAVVSGAVWDLTGVPALAFLPIALCGAVLAGAALLMRAHGRLV